MTSPPMDCQGCNPGALNGPGQGKSVSLRWEESDLAGHRLGDPLHQSCEDGSHLVRLRQQGSPHTTLRRGRSEVNQVLPVSRAPHNKVRGQPICQQGSPHTALRRGRSEVAIRTHLSGVVFGTAHIHINACHISFPAQRME